MTRTQYPSVNLNLFLCRLFEIGAVKIDTKQGFKMKLHEKNPDAPLSPLYLNLRMPDNKGGVLGQVDIDIIGMLMWNYARVYSLNFDGIAGIPRAGEPLSRSLQEIAHHAKKEVALLSFEKIEGEDSRTIGRVLDAQGLPGGSLVLLVDDLITEAGSKVEAINQLEDAGYNVGDVLVFLDRGQGGRQELEMMGVTLHAIVTLGDMLEFYRKKKLITKDEHRIVREYLTANTNAFALAAS